MIRAALLAISLGAVAASAPDLSTIRLIEKTIRLPATADPIDHYDRYYAPDVISGRVVVVGLYLRSDIVDEDERHRRRGDPEWWKGSRPRPGRLHLLARAADLPPGISDGGCEEVYIVWDVATSKSAVECNGYA